MYLSQRIFVYEAIKQITNATKQLVIFMPFTKMSTLLTAIIGFRIYSGFVDVRVTYLYLL